MGSPEAGDHDYKGPRAGFDKSEKNCGAAFLPMRADSREADKIPPRPPRPNDRWGCAGPKLKDGGRKGVMGL